jgi:hypothetical protein
MCAIKSPYFAVMRRGWPLAYTEGLCGNLIKLFLPDWGREL